MKKVVDDRCMAGESLQRGPERTLHEAIKVEPGLNLRAQDVGLARARRCLSGRTAYGEQNQPNRKKCVIVSSAQSEGSSKLFDIR